MLRKLIICLALLLPGLCSAATWQATLESTFDHVDTFDELQTWRGTYYGNDFATEGFPVKLDGSPSMWTSYTNNTEAVDDWIKDHGDYTWRGSKSLCINYMDLASGRPGIDGYGPSRLATYVGDGVSGKSGYPEIHIFFMMKFRQGFFTQVDATTFGDQATTKLMEVCQGFTSVRYFGTPEENAIMCDPYNRGKFEYGANDTVMNVGGGGASTPNILYFRENTLTPWDSNDSGCYDKWILQRNAEHRTADYSAKYLAGEWIGVEVIENVGDVGVPNGSFEVRVYDEAGTLIGSSKGENQLMRTTFDHWYNKVTFGGNMTSPTLASHTEENRYYVDDVVIHGSDVADIYFTQLAAFDAGNPPIPTVSITSPTTGTTCNTTDSVITLSGTATNTTSITCSVAGTVSGTTNWTVSDIPLSMGSNVVTITANGPEGTATYTITVTRTAEPVQTKKTKSTPAGRFILH